MAGYVADWRKRTTHLHEPDDLAEITCELFRFGAEQDALYDAITCDPSYDKIQARLQDDASGERVEEVPRGLHSRALAHLLQLADGRFARHVSCLGRRRKAHAP